MKNKELEQRIEELKMIAFAYEDKECLTDKESKEEKLISEVIEAIDNLKFFYKEENDKLDTISISVDEGYEYAMAIRANVVHRM